VFLLVPADPRSPRQRAVKRVLLLLLSTVAQDSHLKQNTKVQITKSQMKIATTRSLKTVWKVEMIQQFGQTVKNLPEPFGFWDPAR